MIENNEYSLGLGILNYNYGISPEGMLYFSFIAIPKRSDSEQIFETFKYEAIEPACQESVDVILADLENLFLAQFPDSENFFNQRESNLYKSQFNYQFFLNYQVSGIKMTNEYLRDKFVLLGKQMEKSIEETQMMERGSLVCTVL